MSRTSRVARPGPGSGADGLAQKGWKYNEQYGIVPIPTDQTGQTVVAPLGGENLDLGTGGSTEQQKLAWEWMEGMQ